MIREEARPSGGDDAPTRGLYQERHSGMTHGARRAETRLRLTRGVSMSSLSKEFARDTARWCRRNIAATKVAPIFPTGGEKFAKGAKIISSPLVGSW